jgi:ABC-2 type transport system ATP-binding protein
MIIIKDLKKYYNKNLVLNINNFSFLKGKSYLLLGSNGSGKSTLIKCIIGLINYKGFIKRKYKRIAYVPERFPEVSLIKSKTILDCLMVEEEKSIREEIIKLFSEYFSLDLNKNLCALSKGNLQKLIIIQALINKADLFIFDEALNGLDKFNQVKLINIINLLRKAGKTIIITSHYENYYSDCFDYKIILKNGYIDEIK